MSSTSKNHIDSVMDVAIKDGKIAKVAAHIAPSDALKTIDVKGLYVTPGLDRHPCPCLFRHRRAQLLRRRPQRAARRLHIPRWRYDRCRCRLFRLAQFRGLQAAHHRPLQDPRLRDAQHRRLWHARSKVRAEHCRHGWRSHGSHGAQVSRKSLSASRPRTLQARNGLRSNRP